MNRLLYEISKCNNASYILSCNIVSQVENILDSNIKGGKHSNSWMIRLSFFFTKKNKDIALQSFCKWKAGQIGHKVAASFIHTGLIREWILL